MLELFIPGNPPSRLRLGTIWQRAWASTWRRIIDDEETAKTFRDLHLEKSKQTIKLLLYGTFLLLEIISGYHKRFMKPRGITA